jgi:hypothetical protein
MSRRPMASASEPTLAATPFGIWNVTGIVSDFGWAFATRIFSFTL